MIACFVMCTHKLYMYTHRQPSLNRWFPLNNYDKHQSNTVKMFLPALTDSAYNIRYLNGKESLSEEREHSWLVFNNYLCVYNNYFILKLECEWCSFWSVLLMCVMYNVVTYTFLFKPTFVEYIEDMCWFRWKIETGQKKLIFSQVA